MRVYSFAVILSVAIFIGNADAADKISIGVSNYDIFASGNIGAGAFIAPGLPLDRGSVAKLPRSMTNPDEQENCHDDG
jgi:hypothetical protein